MLLLALVAILVVVPVVELYTIIQVAQAIGGLNTIALLLLSSIVGGWLMRVEGFGVLRRFQREVRAGELPAASVVDGLLILVGGLLMLVPGFVSDGLGLLLLLPPVRAVLRPVVLARARRRVEAFVGPVGAATGRRWGTRSTDDDVIDVEGWEEPPRRPGALPRGGRP